MPTREEQINYVFQREIYESVRAMLNQAQRTALDTGNNALKEMYDVRLERLEKSFQQVTEWHARAPINT